MKENEFFIGWQTAQNKSNVQLLRRIAIGLAIGVSILALALSVLHKNYANGRYDRAKISTLTGILRTSPAPFIEIIDGQARTTILLVSPGKFGAEKKLIEKGLIDRVRNKIVTIKGNLIYNGSHTLLEVQDLDLVSDSLYENKLVSNSLLYDIKLIGEIADPKCLFGVMNPGEGKVHKDCAIRCISGGITPVIKIIGSNGNYEYYLIVIESNTSSIQQILPYVADQIEICGRVGRFNEWNLFYPDLNTLQRIRAYNLPAVTACNH